MKNFILITTLICTQFAYSQTDSVKLVKYTSGFRFNDGIYVTHQQLVDNAPIPIKRIVSSYNKSAFDFFDKLLADEVISYYDQFGMKKNVKVDELWGFCRRGSVYINWGDDFNRIPIIGSVCHFIATVTVIDEQYNSPGYGFGYYSMPTNTSRTEIYQFIMIFSLGKVVEYTVENIEVMLVSDSELFTEFHALKQKKKNQMKFLYLRKFNEKHPLYIPIN